jgi:heterodisulfide reductase subunit B
MMKKYALYPGCLMSTEQYAYELSVRAILPEFKIELIDLESFTCCGEPLKSINQLVTLYSSARNIALAEKLNLPILAPCAMCHLALSECKNVLLSDQSLLNRINETLKSEQLKFTGNNEIIHILDLFYDYIGIEKIKELVKYPLDNLKFASHYGCHCIRPKELGRPDDSENPIKMEAILKAIGASSLDYPEKLDCCGGLLQMNHDETALTKSGEKLLAVQNHGVDGLVDVCPWCHKMFDARQKKAGETVAAKLSMPVFYLTQLIGISLDLPPEKLGLDLNKSPIQNILSK